jgi:hypothetical protein
MTIQPKPDDQLKFEDAAAAVTKGDWGTVGKWLNDKVTTSTSEWKEWESKLPPAQKEALEKLRKSKAAETLGATAHNVAKASAGFVFDAGAAANQPKPEAAPTRAPGH